MTSYDFASEPTAAELIANYRRVLDDIREVGGSRAVELVAVSKTKSPACIKCLYDAGHRAFGENYVQEVVEKAGGLPGDIAWHFIGHLQSNKVRDLLLGVPSLAVVQTVDSARLADKLEVGCEQYRGGRPLEVFLQVNTSGEAAKSGAAPGADVRALAAHITARCPHLRLGGLMTIGLPGPAGGAADFACLAECREAVARDCGVAPEALALSMGMSADYRDAIEAGATTVRVGTVLFGQRARKAAG